MGNLFQILGNTYGHFLVSVGLCIMVLVNYAEGEAIPIYHGGTNMTCRSNLLMSSAKKVWIDDTVKLKHGIVQKFYVCTGDMKGEELPRLRLQIWTKLSQRKFKLKLEKIVELSDGDKRIYEFFLNPDERGQVTDQDKIGWTVEGEASPITFTYNHDYTARYYSIRNNQYSKIDDEIITDQIPLPAVFSVGVEIVQEITEEGVDYFGKDIKARKSVHRESGNDRISWIDTSILLGKGKLDSFYFYTASTTEPLPNLRLQIWTPGNQGKYTLKFEKQFLTPKADKKYKVRLDHNEHVFVTNADKIGWTSEGTIVPLSYDYIYPPSTVYYRFKDGAFPVKNNEYKFEEVQVTRVFSVGVSIRKGPFTTTTSTAVPDKKQTSTVRTYQNKDISTQGNTGGYIGRSSTVVPSLLLAVAGLVAQSLFKMHL